MKTDQELQKDFKEIIDRHGLFPVFHILEHIYTVLMAKSSSCIDKVYYSMASGLLKNIGLRIRSKGRLTVTLEPGAKFDSERVLKLAYSFSKILGEYVSLPQHKSEHEDDYKKILLSLMQVARIMGDEEIYWKFFRLLSSKVYDFKLEDLLNNGFKIEEISSEKKKYGLPEVIAIWRKYNNCLALVYAHIIERESMSMFVAKFNDEPIKDHEIETQLKSNEFFRGTIRETPYILVPFAGESVKDALKQSYECVLQIRRRYKELLQEMDETREFLKRLGYEMNFRESHPEKLVFRITVHNPESGGKFDILITRGFPQIEKNVSNIFAEAFIKRVSTALKCIREVFENPIKSKDLVYDEEVLQAIVKKEKKFYAMIHTPDEFKTYISYMKKLIDIGFKLEVLADSSFFDVNVSGFSENSLKRFISLTNREKLITAINSLVSKEDDLVYFKPIANALPKRIRLLYLLRSSSNLSSTDLDLVMEMLKKRDERVERAVLRRLTAYKDEKLLKVFNEYLRNHANNYTALKLLYSLRSAISHNPQNANIEFAKPLIVKALNLPEQYLHAKMTREKDDVLRLTDIKKLPDIKITLDKDYSSIGIEFTWSTPISGENIIEIEPISRKDFDKAVYRELIDVVRKSIKLYQKTLKVQHEVLKRSGSWLPILLYHCSESKRIIEPVTLTVRLGKGVVGVTKFLDECLEKYPAIKVGDKKISFREFLEKLPKKRGNIKV